MTIAELIDSRRPFNVPVSECRFLEGAKVAVWDGRTLYLSPAMMLLARDPADLAALARAVKVIAVPGPTDFLYQPLPLTTPPEVPKL